MAPSFFGGVCVRRDGWPCAACSYTAAAHPAIPRLGSTAAPQRTSHASSLRVRVVGTTNTQAVLTYSAPDDGACTVKVSQQASLTPLVRDVDPALFPGADQDTRPETVTAKTNRIFVVGKRITQRASDGKNYSRALETYATHYYQVACGSAVATGSFTTANIPLGMTYNDVPQVDESNPGQWMIPTQLQDRTQTIVDPQTGALLKRVSLDAEAGNRSYGYAGAFLTYGGFNRVCSACAHRTFAIQARVFVRLPRLRLAIGALVLHRARYRRGSLSGPGPVPRRQRQRKRPIAVLLDTTARLIGPLIPATFAP